ncbi:hypothetical protein GTZ99_01195 [Novosphingobium sp. FSY-8]|uniref:Uncharacterized protein n=1 Tax=Novosphingobium ovatum TaxID=1908523 RepID=A0ABW9X9F9_9SPHN|nr:hypothetical protein [Novosphingobium ovatum]NBC35170.1 hypothetical protein [Novosphingobium ovatum]
MTRAHAALPVTRANAAPIPASPPPAVPPPAFPRDISVPQRPLEIARGDVPLPGALPPIPRKAAAHRPPAPQAAASHTPTPDAATRPALPLPVAPASAEYLVTQALDTSSLPEQDSTLPQAPDSILPRNRSLAVPTSGLACAIGNWLRSAANLLPWRRRPRAARPLDEGRGFGAPTRRKDGQPSLREQTEMTQLRAENRRLRQQLDTLETLRQAEERAREAAAAARAREHSQW